MVLAGLAAVLFLTVLALDKPPERNERAITAATVAAAQEYDRVMELCGDSASAMSASDMVFQNVLEKWYEEGSD